MDMRTAVLLLFAAGVCNALSADEVAQFENSGTYGGSISFESYTNGAGENVYKMTANGLPDHEVDNSLNPNEATAQSYEARFRETPVDSATPGCVPPGVIGYSTQGVGIFNPLTSASLNAVEGTAEEEFDDCNGHSDQPGRYHYHKLPSCLVDSSQTDQLLGVALDGYPIYGPSVSLSSAKKRAKKPSGGKPQQPQPQPTGEETGEETGGETPDSGSNTKVLTSADLDECHGSSEYGDGSYRYYVTDDFPYILGCFKAEIYGASSNVMYTCNDAESEGLCHCSGGASVQVDYDDVTSEAKRRLEEERKRKSYIKRILELLVAGAN